MTVQELIQALSDLPNQNLNVTIDGQEVTFVGINEFTNSVDIETDFEETIKELSTEEKYNMLPESIQLNIDELLENFNFDRVHEFMKLINWTWLDEGVPPVYSLLECAKELLVEACYNSYNDPDNKDINYTVETGGFFARAWDAGQKFELRFNLESLGNE